MFGNSQRSWSPGFFIAVACLFALTACGGSSGSNTGGNQIPATQNPATQNPATQNPDNQGDDTNPVDPQGGNPNASASYFPTSSTDPALTDLQWQYVFSNGDITSNTDAGTINVNLSGISVRMANTMPTERVVQFSGPFTADVEGEAAAGRLESILSEEISQIDNRAYISRLNTNILISIFADDEFGQLDTEVDLQINYPEAIEIYLDQDDLNERVGEVFTRQVSGTLSGTISLREEFFADDTRDFPSSSTTVTETYTVSSVLSSMTVQGVTYNDVVAVDYSYKQLNPQTGELEPTTTTYFLARGIGLIKASNLTRLYEASLDWELVSTNLAQ